MRWVSVRWPPAAGAPIGLFLLHLHLLLHSRLKDLSLCGCCCCYCCCCTSGYQDLLSDCAPRFSPDFTLTRADAPSLLLLSLLLLLLCLHFSQHCPSVSLPQERVRVLPLAEGRRKDVEEWQGSEVGVFWRWGRRVPLFSLSVCVFRQVSVSALAVSEEDAIEKSFTISLLSQLLHPTHTPVSPLSLLFSLTQMNI